MRILSNEYLENIPGSEKKAQGGPSRFAYNLSKYLSEHGNEWVGILRSPTTLPNEYRELKNSHYARYFEVYVPKINFESIRELSEPVVLHSYLHDEVELISRFIREIKPDVLFINGFSSFCWLLYAAAKNCNIPILIQHAGITKIEVEQYRDLFSEAGATMCFDMEKEVTLHATSNIVLNSYSEGVLASTHGLESIPNSIIIPLPLIDWPFTIVTKKIHHKDITLGVVARWDRIKNHSAILALAEEIKKQNLPWKIRSVTKIPETDTYKEMKTRYKELIDVVSPMDQQELQKFYSSVDIALLPSHFDVSPNVVMEALSTGTPTLISPHVGWVSEYLQNEMQDWIISYEKPQEVVEKIKKLLDRAEWNEVEKLANYIKMCHNAETVYKKYLDLFEEKVL